MTDVWVLGSTGMLGTAIIEELEIEGLSYVEINRDFAFKLNLGFGTSFESDYLILDEAKRQFGMPKYVINAIGIVKPRINEDSRSSVVQAVSINTLFPLNLASFCLENSIHLVQIATDCVFSGDRGGYLESDLHDPYDVYGKTKSLGEDVNSSISLIRCSIIGREKRNKYSLVEWINSQKSRASINGFTNHNWNGITTKVFGKISVGIIKDKLTPVGGIHLIPKDKVSKFELVNIIKNELGRNDITVKEFEANVVIDRTLSTNQKDLNSRLWQSAGFENPPTISEMVNLGL